MRDIPLLLSDEFARDPHHYYRMLRAEAPIHFDESVGGYLVSTFDEVRAVYRNPQFSTAAYAWQIEPVHGRTILQMDGAEHAKQRALISPYFRGKGLDAWMSVIMSNAHEVIAKTATRSAHELLDRLSDVSGGQVIDLMDGFARHYPVAVIAEMLGLERRDHPMFHRWYTTVVKVISNLGRDPGILAEGQQVRAEIREFLIPLYEARSESPGTDLISALATAEVDGYRMSAEEVCAYVSLLLVAGAETTDKTFGNLFANLLQDPDVWQRVRDDRSLLPAAIAETLRFTPPTQINTREAVAEVDLDGTVIPSGATVFTLIGSANRDEKRFERPDEFWIDRPDLTVDRAFSGSADHVAFGSGRHFCLGSLLAKAELETGANVLMDRYPEVRLAPGVRVENTGVKMRGPKMVPVLLGQAVT